MRKSSLSLLMAMAASAAMLAGTASLAQHGGGGGGGGSGISGSGGELPYDGDTARQQIPTQPVHPPVKDEYAAGITALQQHQYADAIQHLEAALAKKPDDANTLFYLGYAHHMVGQHLTDAARTAELGKTLDLYQRSLAINSSNKDAHQYLGVVNLQLHNPNAAQEQITELQSLCPSGCEQLDKLRSIVAASSPTPGPATTPPAKQ